MEQYPNNNPCGSGNNKLVDGNLAMLEEFDENNIDNLATGTKEDGFFDECVGVIQDLLLDETFVSETESFMVGNCHHFDPDSEENKLIYTELFQKYTDIVENFIQQTLADKVKDFDMEVFLNLLPEREDQIDPEIMDLLVNMGDFSSFKEMMLDIGRAQNSSTNLMDPLTSPPLPALWLMYHVTSNVQHDFLRTWFLLRYSRGLLGCVGSKIVEKAPNSKVRFDPAKGQLHIGSFFDLPIFVPRIHTLCMAAAIDNKTRFETELEFVQCLANPFYIHFLARHNHLEDPDFISYLDYLYKYWKSPRYAIFLRYPHCLFYLAILQEPETRTKFKDENWVRIIEQQQSLDWKYQKHMILAEAVKNMTTKDANSGPFTPAFTSIGNNLPHIKAAIGEMQGERGSMEDANCIVALSGENTSRWIDGTSTMIAAAIFDGHGGNFVSRYASQEFIPSLCYSSEALEKVDVRTALKNAFARIEIDLKNNSDKVQEFAKKAKIRSNLVNRRLQKQGTCALAVIVGEEKQGDRWHVHFANLGDSRLILCDRSKSDVKELTIDHKPSLISEKERIEAAGGLVLEESRINGEIAVARALGDFKFKAQEHLASDAQLISSVPHCGYIKAHPGQILVLACDGIWDVISSQECGDIIRQNISEGIEASCRSLMEECLKRGTKDNMS
eukprot:UC4_evm4s44